MLEYVKPFYLHTDAFIAAYGILDSVLTSRRRKNANARSFPEILNAVSACESEWLYGKVGKNWILLISF